MSVSILISRLEKYLSDYELSGEKEYLFKAQAELRNFMYLTLGKDVMENENNNKY